MMDSSSSVSIGSGVSLSSNDPRFDDLNHRFCVIDDKLDKLLWALEKSESGTKVGYHKNVTMRVRTHEEVDTKPLVDESKPLVDEGKSFVEEGVEPLTEVGKKPLVEEGVEPLTEVGKKPSIVEEAFTKKSPVPEVGLRKLPVPEGGKQKENKVPAMPKKVQVVTPSSHKVTKPSSAVSTPFAIPKPVITIKPSPMTPKVDVTVVNKHGGLAPKKVAPKTPTSKADLHNRRSTPFHPPTAKRVFGAPAPAPTL